MNPGAARVFGQAYHHLLRPEEQAFLAAATAADPIPLTMIPVPLDVRRPRGSGTVGLHMRTPAGSWLAVRQDAPDPVATAGHELGHELTSRLLPADWGGSLYDASLALLDAAPTLTPLLARLHPGTAGLGDEAMAGPGRPAGPALAEVIALLYESRGRGRLPDHPALRRLREALAALALYYTEGP